MPDFPAPPAVSRAGDPAGHDAWRTDALAAEVATVASYGGQVVAIETAERGYSTTAIIQRAARAARRERRRASA